MTLHLTGKNCFVFVAGVCMVLLAAIGVVVPPDHWGLSPWKWIILGLVACAIVGLLIQLFVQSREDHERAIRDNKLDERHQGIETKLTEITQLVAKGTEVSTATDDKNAIQTLNPPVDFNADKHFLTAWQSILTADVEKRIKVAALQNKATLSPEEFYSKFIGIGVVAYMHDLTWAYIWKSQVLMLNELNRRGGIMPVDSAKDFYAQGSKDYPGFYTNYTFDKWMTFLVSQQLVILHPSAMVEITVRGRDFLGNMGHTSRSPDQKKG